MDIMHETRSPFFSGFFVEVDAAALGPLHFQDASVCGVLRMQELWFVSPPERTGFSVNLEYEVGSNVALDATPTAKTSHFKNMSSQFIHELKLQHQQN